MRDYDIKRGHWKNVEGKKLRALLEEHFGDNVEDEDGVLYVRDWNAFNELSVEYVDKTTLRVDTDMNLQAENDEMVASRETWNDFLEAATGFNAKKRRKRLKDKAKEGEL